MAAHREEMLDPFVIPLHQYGYFDLVPSLEGFQDVQRVGSIFFDPDFHSEEQTKIFHQMCFLRARNFKILFPKVEAKRVAYTKSLEHSKDFDGKKIVNITLCLKYYDESIYNNRQIYNAKTIIPWLLCCQHLGLPNEIGYSVALYLNDLPFTLPKKKESTE